MRRLWRSTFGLVALVAVAFALTALAIGGVTYFVTHEALEQQLDHRVAVETHALLLEARGSDLRPVADAIRARGSVQASAGLDYLLLDGGGRTIAATMVPVSAPKAGYEERFRFHRGGEPVEGQAFGTRIADGLLVVVADRRDLVGIDRTLEALLAAALGSMLVFGVGAAALIGWLTQRRLSRIDVTAQAIIAGDLTQRIPRDGSGSEFDRLAATLNRMLDRIGALMESLQQVSSDVAHDLRTPLTRLCNRLELAAVGVDEDERRRAVEAARRQADELLQIFAALLRIAEVEGAAEGRPRALVDVSALLSDMAETYRPEFEASGRRLTDAVAPDLHVRGDRRLLAQAISNLLENALRHTPPGTVAALTAQAVSRQVEIMLEDDGPGSLAEDPDRLFQRFARGEAARSTSGHGLGLALVRAIARSHGGSAEVSRAVGGFGVRISLPAEPLPRWASV